MKEYKTFIEDVMNDLKYELFDLIKWAYHERFIILNALISFFLMKKELLGERLDLFLNLAMSMTLCYVILIIVFCLYRYKLSILEIIFLVARKLVFYYLVSISILTLGYCYYQRENIYMLIILMQSILVIIDHDHIIVFKTIAKTTHDIWLHFQTKKQKY